MGAGYGESRAASVTDDPDETPNPVTPLLDRDPQATRVDRFLAPYVQQPGLWPVAIVLVAHGILAVAAALIDAWRSQAGFAVWSLLLIGAATAWAWGVDWRRGRFGLVSRTFLMIWPLGVVSAYYAQRWELY